MRKIFLTLLASMAVFTVSAQFKAPQIVANAGFHKSPSSGARNSMSALKAAQKAKFYASECDVNLTKDGEVLVVQSGWHPSQKSRPRADVQTSSKEKILSIPYNNGEHISTLEQYLKRAAKKPATKLILDLKSQRNPQRETELVESVLSIVARMGMQDQVEYIADHPWTCFELAKKAPKGTKISYLNGKYTPQYVKAMGCTGIDYHISSFKKNKKLIAQAHKVGLTVNVLTVDKESDIRWCVQNGVDFITTNNPDLAKKIIKEMCK